MSQAAPSPPPAFIFSDETSYLDDAEYDRVCGVLRQAERLVEYRQTRLAGVAHYQPANNWDIAKAQSNEIDGQAFNHYTSYRLLQSKDREILQKLLLYAQSFSGHQLATWAPSHKRPWIRQKLPHNIDEFLKLILTWPDEIYQLYKQTTAAMPSDLRVPMPWRLGNIGWQDGDIIVNIETFRYHHHLRLLGENDVIHQLRDVSRTRSPVILEIGSGYGALAFCLSVLFPSARIVLVDLPECLAFAASYLSVNRPEADHQFVVPTSEGEIDIPSTPGFTYLANFLVDRVVPSLRYDLSINTASLTEMTADQIEAYARHVSSHSTPASVFYERNTHLAGDNERSALQTILARFFRRMSECRSTVQLIGSRERAYLWRL